MQMNHNDIQVLADTAQKLQSKYEAVIKKWKVLNHFVDSLKKKDTPAFNYHYMRYTNYRENYYQLSEMNKPAFGISPFPETFLILYNYYLQLIIIIIIIILN